MSREGPGTASGPAAGAADPERISEALARALRAPSAHNAQPWRLSPADDGSYVLWYADADRLLADPDDRDGLMAMGGFYETLRLAASELGLDIHLDWADSRLPDGRSLGTISFAAATGGPDPLAPAVASRQCNRNPYSRTPPPAALAKALGDLGNLLLPPHLLTGLVARASVLAWKDPRFIRDLSEWTRFDDHSPDGMTVDCLRLNGVDQAALKFALGLGRLPRVVARLFAERDVRLTRSSGAMAVLVADDRRPETLFECGRRLVRSWTLVNALGYSWHPMSIVIDQATVTDLASLIGGLDPVAIYRVGYTADGAAWSKRRDLSAVMVARAAEGQPAGKM